MNATKARWKITAGIIIGQPMDEYNKVFLYDSNMYESDKQGDVIFHTMADEAYYYAKTLTNPGMVNWVNVEFVWF